MRPIVPLLPMTLLVAALANAADTRSQSLKEFDFCGVVGTCLIVKCQVFRGAMLTDSPKPGEPVTVQVREWLFGVPAPTETVLVPYDDRFQKTGLGGTTEAWRNAKIQKGAPVTVLMARETNAEVIEGEPVLVTFDEHETMLIRSVIQEASLLKDKPDLIVSEVATLSRSANPARAGYLLHYVLFSKEITQRGLSAELLTDMLGNPGIPAERWNTIPFFLYMYSGSLQPEGRVAVMRRYADLAQREDENAALTGFMGLGMIALNADNTLRSQLAPATLSRIASRYRALMGNRAFKRDSLLEAVLGLKER